MNRRIGLTVAFACLVAVLMVRVEAQRGTEVGVRHVEDAE